MQADLKRIRDEVLELSADLAPVRKEDLELISTRETQRTVKKWFVRNVKAVFTSILKSRLLRITTAITCPVKKGLADLCQNQQVRVFFWQHRGKCRLW
ncbi:MAG: hypothetical protein IPJ00_21425 [Saprospirales bacterium]|nr:hypothetical protein [Saprospirales bacterium]